MDHMCRRYSRVNRQIYILCFLPFIKCLSLTFLSLTCVVYISHLWLCCCWTSPYLFADIHGTICLSDFSFFIHLYCLPKSHVQLLSSACHERCSLSPLHHHHFIVASLVIWIFHHHNHKNQHLLHLCYTSATLSFVPTSRHSNLRFAPAFPVISYFGFILFNLLLS